MGLNLCIVFFQLWNKCPTTIDRLVSMGLGRWPLAVSSQTEGSSVGTFAAQLYVSCAVFFHACCCKSHVANWLCCGLSLGSLTICQCMATPGIISAFWTRIWWEGSKLSAQSCTVTFSLRSLQHYCVMVSLRWAKLGRPTWLISGNRKGVMWCDMHAVHIWLCLKFCFFKVLRTHTHGSSRWCGHDFHTHGSKLQTIMVWEREGVYTTQGVYTTNVT